MSSASQKRALKNYRDRLCERGMARFEVLGRDADRDLIRSLARRLAEDGPDADPRWSALSLIYRDHSSPAAPSIFDPLPSRHQHHQQPCQACPIGLPAGVDGRTAR
jgi:hypothetical protein